MKQQVSRLSPHQNGKVFAVLMAISSLVLFVPFALIASAFDPAHGASAMMFLLMPLFYLVFGYIMVALSCWFYNLMFRFVGGIEFESKGESL